MRYHKACIVQIDLHPFLQRDILQHRSRYGHVKRKIIHFIMKLYRNGYRHFVIHIVDPSDLWVAEIIYFLTIAFADSDLIYSIGLWLDEEDHYPWLDDSIYFSTEVFTNAKRVFWRSERWYDNYYKVERTYIGCR